MDIHLDYTPDPRWTMEFPADFRSLKVIARGSANAEALSDAVTSAGLGRADGVDHVTFEREAIKRLAGIAAEAPGWHQGFSAMLAYADAHGWTDDTGAVRAHVRWVS